MPRKSQASEALLVVCGRGRKREGCLGTVSEPPAKLADFLGLNVSFLKVLDKVGDDLVHMWFHGQYAGHRVVAHNRAFELGMLNIVCFTEHVVCDLAVNY